MHQMSRVGFTFALRIAALAGAVAILTACVSPPVAAPAAAQKIRLVAYTTGFAPWVGYLADNKGFFKKNNLDVEFVSVAAGAQATAAMAGGSVDIANLDGLSIAPLMAGGVNMRLLVGEMKNYWILVGSKSFQGKPMSEVIRGLKDQQVAVPSLGGAGGRLTQLLAMAYGMGPDDIKLVADVLGTGFLSGQVPAYMNDPINTSLMAGQGYPVVFSFVNPVEPLATYPPDVQRMIGLAGLSYWSQADWADAHKDAIPPFQKAIAQTIVWATNPANQTELTSIMRASPFNVATMSDDQWKAAAAVGISTLQAQFSEQDRDTWNDMVAKLGIAPGMPPTSAFFATGLPKSPQEAADLGKN